MGERAHVVIIGAGVGGLCAAVRLAAAGLRVTLLERAARPGGKMREIAVGGVAFDAGPSVLTMPWVFDELFQAVGERREDWLRFEPLEPACRHFFPEGLVLDLYNDEPGAAEPWARSAEAIAQALGARAAEQYRRFRRHTAELYRAVERPFLRRPLPRTLLGLLLARRLGEIGDAAGLLRLDARRSVWQSLGRHFDDGPLRVLFARYATYSGSDPFRAPATLNVIPQVELGFGVHAVRGGMYRLAEALAALAARRGATLRCGAEVERLELDPGERRAVAVHLRGERLRCDAVVVNCDVPQLHHRLLAGTRRGARAAAAVGRLEPSLSAHLRLVLARPGAGLPLCHHNVFFSADYEWEFTELRTGPPADPTVYLCDSPAPGEGLRRWFFLVNAPPLAPDDDGQARAGAEAALVRAAIARKIALAGADLDRCALAEAAVTPADFAALFPHSRGALYGSASNALMSAFWRPRNRVPGLGNVYCVGGSTHPGAGVPMVALSAELASGLLLADLAR